MSKSPHVLIVEDEPFILFAASDHLEDEGFRVSLAKHAEEALTLLSQNLDISLLFTDVDMPGTMDGLALASATRDRWPEIKIIVTSGRRQVEITDIPDGAIFYSKPYDLGEIAASMRVLLK